MIPVPWRATKPSWGLRPGPRICSGDGLRLACGLVATGAGGLSTGAGYQFDIDATAYLPGDPHARARVTEGWVYAPGSPVLGVPGASPAGTWIGSGQFGPERCVDAPVQ